MNFKTPDSLQQVAEFHRTFLSPILEKPQIPSQERTKLRINLLEEELKELKKAIEDNDIIEVADAFCDLQYVLSGAILEFGLGEKFFSLFNEVHNSNMTKACYTEQEAIDTVEKNKEKGVECYYTKSNNIWLVFRKSDNKTIKSIYYSPVNLNKII